MTSRLADPLDAFEPSQVIRDATRFMDLLDSPVIGILIKRCEARWFEEMKRASSSEALLVCQAKAKTLDDVLHALHEVMDAGERDAIERERQRPAQEGVSA